jgi:hypothetical protein
MVGGWHFRRRAPSPDGAARLVIAGFLLAVVGVLVFAAELTGGGDPGSSAGFSGATSASAGPSATVSQKVVSPAAGRHGDPLGAVAGSYVAGRSGVVLAAVYDLRTEQAWTIGDDRRGQDEASIVKLDILETLFAQQRGGLSGTDRVLARQMIEDSDNDSATRLWSAVGGARGIRAFNAAVALAGTSPSACVRCPGFSWPGWGLTTTTPLDQLALLRELVSPSPFVRTADRDFALRLMENVAPSQRWGVSGGVPAQVTVALKNGWLPLNAAGTDWQVNSIGWVRGLGRDYLIAVLSSGNPTEAYGIDTIDGLSAIVWNRMR